MNTIQELSNVQSSRDEDRDIVQKILNTSPRQRPYTTFILAPAIQDDATYWQTVATLWIDCGTSGHVGHWLDLFRADRPGRWKMMKKRDRNVWRSLPDVVRAYRAVRDDEASEYALSWSLDRAVCVRLYPNRRIVQRNIPRADILAYFDRRGEREILVLPGGPS